MVEFYNLLIYKILFLNYLNQLNYFHRLVYKMFGLRLNSFEYLLNTI